MSDAKARALAAHVALRLDRIDPGICPAWLEAAERRCGKPATIGLLCARHHAVAERRQVAVAKAEAARLAKIAARIPGWRARLAEVEAELAAGGSSLPLDRAAYTGNHPGLPARHLAAGHVERMAHLTREADRLRALIGDDA